MIVALIGPHGVGKSTLGARLAARLGVPFDDEIGAALARDPSWRPDATTAHATQPAFDDEVFRRELARDAARGDTPRVVESWHPVNLAYASKRSPDAAHAWLPTVRASVARRRVVVVPLWAPPEVLADRQWEAGDASFFADVGFGATLWADRLGCAPLTPVWTHHLDPDALARRVATTLEPSWNAST